MASFWRKFLSVSHVLCSSDGITDVPVTTFAVLLAFVWVQGFELGSSHLYDKHFSWSTQLPFIVDIKSKTHAFVHLRGLSSASICVTYSTLHHAELKRALPFSD